MWPGTCHLWCLLSLLLPAPLTSPHLPLPRNLVAIFDNICARCGDCRLPFALTRVVGGRRWGDEGGKRIVTGSAPPYIYLSVCVCVWVAVSVCVCHFAVGSLGFAFCLSCGICLCGCVCACVCAHVCDCGAGDCLWLD